MAYDTKALVEQLKPLGLEMAEETAVKAVDVIIDWAVDEAAKSENKIDDVVVSLFPMLKPVIIGEGLDLIDGEDNR